MSANGRGPRKGGAEQFYPTPAHIVRQIVERLALPGGRWLEPAAGQGAIIRAVNALRSDVEWSAVELRSECLAVLQATGAQTGIADFLTAMPLGHFAVAILNPPFTLAQQFVERCLDMADWVVCLERLNWLEGPREAFLSEHMPDVYVLSARPSFTGGQTDSCAYAWFVLPPGEHDRRVGRVEVLPSLPGQRRLFAEATP